MRNMSFMLTAAAIRDRSKTVTRRLGWWYLEPGEVLQAVEKSQGLKKGEKVVPLALIRITSVRAEKLARMVDLPAYGMVEVAAEGCAARFPNPWQFVDFFMRSHKGCELGTVVNRIEFEYMEPQ